jgi:dienelactone hydrolase
MKERQTEVEIAVGPRHVAGTVVPPNTMVEGMLFVHGWAGNQQQYLARAQELAALGCMSLTFDLYGHAATASFQSAATREENLADVLAAYDFLAKLPNVNAAAIGVVGSSYGGYLSAILTALRPVQWLALRAPALYRDQDWEKAKQSLNREDLMAYRRMTIAARENRALEACSRFRGDVLLVESEHDDIVPSSVTANYRTAFANARSLTVRVIEGADHALSAPQWQDAYTSLLKTWARGVVVKTRLPAIEERDSVAS